MIPGKARKQEGSPARDLCLGCGDTWLFALQLAVHPASGLQVLGATVLPKSCLSHLSYPSSSPSPPPSVLVLHTNSLPCILPCLCATCSDCPFPT